MTGATAPGAGSPRTPKPRLVPTPPGGQDAGPSGRAGFTSLPSEWWHYDYGNQQWAWYRVEERAIYGPMGPESLAERGRRQLG